MELHYTGDVYELVWGVEEGVGEIKYHMDAHTWWQLFRVTSSLPMCNACMLFMQVISTCCHFSLNVLVTYFPVLTRCSLQVVDNQCFLQSLKDSLYFAIFSDCVQLWTGRLTELDGWMGTSQTSTRSSNTGSIWSWSLVDGHCHRNNNGSNISPRSWGGPAVAAHAAHSNASCSTDLTCMCTFCTCTHCETGTGIDTVFSFHCEDSALHYC